MKQHLELLFNSNVCVLKWAQLRLLRKYAPHLGGDLLDAGCGHRAYARAVPCASYVGLEVKAASRPDVVGSVMRMPFAAEAFDSVLCQEVLEHVPRPTDAVSEVRRVLRQGGHAYVTVPQMWYSHYEPHDYRRFTSHGLRHVLESHGLEVVALERTGGFWRFVLVRSVETAYRLLRLVLLPLAVHNATRNAVARFLCSPLNAAGLLLAPLLDTLSRRDHLGWVALARKP